MWAGDLQRHSNDMPCPVGWPNVQRRADAVSWLWTAPRTLRPRSNRSISRRHPPGGFQPEIHRQHTTSFRYFQISSDESPSDSGLVDWTRDRVWRRSRALARCQYGLVWVLDARRYRSFRSTSGHRNNFRFNGACMLDSWSAEGDVETWGDRQEAAVKIDSKLSAFFPVSSHL